MLCGVGTVVAEELGGGEHHRELQSTLSLCKAEGHGCPHANLSVYSICNLCLRKWFKECLRAESRSEGLSPGRGVRRACGLAGHSALVFHRSTR